jgi:hypothetical protein
VQEILRHSNVHVLHELDRLTTLLRDAPGVQMTQLAPYYTWVKNACEELRQSVEQNLRDLDLGQSGILSAIASETQKVIRFFYMLDQRLAGPVLRARPSDRLCLSVLRWLHEVHPQTQHIPAAVSDGQFASYPDPHWPTIYFMPPSAQTGLLYLPLFFHEFGHLLYACHEPEMDALVEQLQETLAELLTPGIQREDLHDRIEVEKRRTIVETWYAWAQELFCDAIGLTIGGPAFAHAFSMHLQMLGRGHFYLPAEDLARRDHPVTWLRIQLLVHRAREMGHQEDAEILDTRWKTLATALGIVADYHGFYEEEFLPTIQETVDDMLTEAAPVTYSEEMAGSSARPSLFPSPIRLLHRAWQQFGENHDEFRQWEEQEIVAFLQS